MRKTLRIFFWMIKGVLLMIALVVLVMWPVTSRRWIVLRAERMEEWGQYYYRSIGCAHGQIILTDGYSCVSNPASYQYLRERFKGSTAWRFEWESVPIQSERSVTHEWPWSRLESTWGPIRWDFYRAADGDRQRQFGTPLWLVALVAGAWPVFSIVVAAQRRIRRGGAGQEGLCAKCGYDLRATAKPAAQGGELLAVCPECGHLRSLETKA